MQFHEGQLTNHSLHLKACLGLLAEQLYFPGPLFLAPYSLRATNVLNRLDLQNSSQQMFHIFYIFALACHADSVPSLLGFRVTLKANRRHLFKISGSNCSADEQKRTSQAA